MPTIAGALWSNDKIRVPIWLYACTTEKKEIDWQ